MHTRYLNIIIKFKVKIAKMAMLVYGLIYQCNGMKNPEIGWNVSHTRI